MHLELPQLGDVFAAVAAELGVPLRGHSPARYYADFYGQWDDGSTHLELVSVERLGEDPGAGARRRRHRARLPSRLRGGRVQSSYLPEREAELRTLCDPRVRERLDGARHRADQLRPAGRGRARSEGLRHLGATVVLSAHDVLQFPLGGGHFSAYLQYVHGLRALGCEVWWLERVAAVEPGQDGRRVALELSARLGAAGLPDRLIVYAGGSDRERGFLLPDAARAEAVIARADVLLNFHYELDAEMLARFRRTALIDIDPGLLQMWIAGGHLDVHRARPLLHDRRDGRHSRREVSLLRARLDPHPAAGQHGALAAVATTAGAHLHDGVELVEREQVSTVGGVAGEQQARELPGVPGAAAGTPCRWSSR